MAFWEQGVYWVQFLRRPTFLEDVGNLSRPCIRMGNVYECHVLREFGYLLKGDCFISLDAHFI
jgi:hypothetical protein